MPINLCLMLFQKLAPYLLSLAVREKNNLMGSVQEAEHTQQLDYLTHKSKIARGVIFRVIFRVILSDEIKHAARERRHYCCTLLHRPNEQWLRSGAQANRGSLGWKTHTREALRF